MTDLPAGLDAMPPGPKLAALLDRLEHRPLSAHDRVRVLKARARLIGWQQAKLYADMAAVVDEMADLEDPWEAAATEIGAALCLTRSAAGTELSVAIGLRRRLPHVWGMLALGLIDARRARVMVDTTDHLPVEAARQIVAQVADQAAGWTTGQIGARVRRLCIAHDPADAAKRYEGAVRQRRVVAHPSPHGTAQLSGFDLPPDRVAAITDRINRIACSLRSRHEPRSMDQLRADVFCDLLDGTTNYDGRGGVVDIQVDLATLAELSEAPGDLNGFGPVISGIARDVVDQQPRAEWRYTVTDPDTGDLVAGGITRRRPTAGQRRAVQSRDRTCRFKGCRRPAIGCDLDHQTPWAEGGPTSIDNLVPLCRYHHRRRHLDGWSHTRLPDGDYHWTSPLGHTYTTSGRPP